MLAASEYAAMAVGIGGVLWSVNQLAQARTTAGRIAEVLAEPPWPTATSASPKAPEGWSSSR
ncbi:hypothetical protein [Streptomyces sp. TLI_185]|uniref:hypothetical protein n=1 Tax=Streptomyces sp. TLI_185 TaxID=2485151 RepID=UPI00161B5A03|nr:hypothetical protein [Streptomyces sp. TLI_185]